jgi:hypothetical protein
MALKRTTQCNQLIDGRLAVLIKQQSLDQRRHRRLKISIFPIVGKSTRPDTLPGGH